MAVRIQGAERFERVTGKEERMRVEVQEDVGRWENRLACRERILVETHEILRAGAFR